MEINRYENGNVTIKRTEDEILKPIYISYAAMEAIRDCVLLGDPYYCRNHDMCQSIYCFRNDKVYSVLLGEMQNDFNAGREIELYASPADDDDRTLANKCKRST